MINFMQYVGTILLAAFLLTMLMRFLGWAVGCIKGFFTKREKQRTELVVCLNNRVWMIEQKLSRITALEQRIEKLEKEHAKIKTREWWDTVVKPLHPKKAKSK